MMSWQCDGADYDPTMTNLSSSSFWALRILPIFLLYKASRKPGTKTEDWEDMYLLGSVYLKDLGHTTKQLAPLDPCHHPRSCLQRELLRVSALGHCLAWHWNSQSQQWSCWFRSLPYGPCALINEKWSMQMAMTIHQEPAILAVSLLPGIWMHLCGLGMA